MKNIDVWRGSLGPCLGILLIAGCTVRPAFRAVEVQSNADAFEALLQRRMRIERYSTRATFELTVPKGKFNLNGELNYSADDGWILEFRGPMRTRVAVLEITDSSYVLYLPQTGYTEQGSLADSLAIPDLDIYLANTDHLTNMLFPTTDILPDEGWRLENPDRPVPGGEMSIIREPHGESAERLQLCYSTEAFQLLSESRYRIRNFEGGLSNSPLSEPSDNRLVYVRRFIYDERRSTVPSAVEIEGPAFILRITYRSQKLQLSSPTTDPHTVRK